MAYWLMKSEPDVFGIHTLKQQRVAPWDGVRNYLARNHMRSMQVGDQILFYHSNAKPSGVAGLARVAKLAYPDHTSFDPSSKYYDPKSTPENPRWFIVDVRFEQEFPQVIPLDYLRAIPELQNMVLLHSARLSVQPVSAEEFAVIVKLGETYGRSATRR
jgi:predicted RNA-binding protein with PUA-like domain